MTESANKQLVFGTLANMPDPTLYTPDEGALRTHMAIFGGTRYGKSKLFEQICRELIVHDCGFALIDPHSDTADDILANLAFYQEELGFTAAKIVYINPNDALFSYDPFVYEPDPDDPDSGTEFGYQKWLFAKIKDMVQIIVRKQGESEEEAQKMVRLRRWLFNALYAVGVRQDSKGTHFSLNEAIPLLSPMHARHEELYHAVEPHLPDNVRVDFVKLRATKDPRRQEDWIESTVNRLRELLSPITERIFNREAPPINFRQIIANDGIILASLGKTTGFHPEEAQVLAGLIIREISDAVATTPRTQRNQYYLFIDEAQNFLGEDLIRLFKESAKHRLSLGIAVQQLDNLQKGQLDLVPTVLGMCGIRMTFRQKFHEHAETLAKTLCYPMLDFSRLVHEVERHDGYDWVTVVSESFSHTEGKSRSDTEGNSTQHSTSRSKGKSTTESITESIGKTLSESRTMGRGRTFGQSRGISFTESNSDSSSSGTSQGNSTSKSGGDPNRTTSGFNDQATVSTGVSKGRARTENEGDNWTSSLNEGKSLSTGANEGRGRGSSTSYQNSVSETDGYGTMSSVTVGTSSGDTAGQSFTPTSQARVRVEQQDQGRLTTSVDDQIAQFTVEMMQLAKQHCLVSVDSHKTAFLLRVADVLDPFVETELEIWRDKSVHQMKKQIFDRFPFFFHPRLTAPPDPTDQKCDQGGTNESTDTRGPHGELFGY
jgi:hypothetical protein